VKFVILTIKSISILKNNVL